jgi:ribulose-phosphate 3-epimerase
MQRGFLIAPSILSADFSNLEAAIGQAKAGGADWIHVDVMDGHFVPNLTMGPVVVEGCRKATDLPLDVHLMMEAPERFLRAFADAGADSITIQVESGPHLHRTLQSVRELGLRVGVTMNPATPAASIQHVIHMVDLILVMTVNPGFSGQDFIQPMLEKIKAVRDLRDRHNPEARIEVDGGINPQTAPWASEAGAEVFVAGSAIFEHPEGIAAGVRALRHALLGRQPR